MPGSKSQTGDLEGAKGILEEMVHKTPDYLPGWLGLAEIAAAQTKYDESATYLSKLLARDPQNYEALLLSGRLELAKGETVKAMADLERMAGIYPEVAAGPLPACAGVPGRQRDGQSHGQFESGADRGSSFCRRDTGAGGTQNQKRRREFRH